MSLETCPTVYDWKICKSSTVIDLLLFSHGRWTFVHDLYAGSDSTSNRQSNHVNISNSKCLLDFFFPDFSFLFSHGLNVPQLLLRHKYNFQPFSLPEVTIEIIYHLQKLQNESACMFIFYTL